MREALLTLERLRAREARALHESNAVLDGLAKVAGASSPAEAINALLISIKRHLAASEVILFAIEQDGERARVISSTAAPEKQMTWRERGHFLERSRRLYDLHALPWRPFGENEAAQAFRGMISVPVRLGDASRAALACLHEQCGAFEASDLRVLERLAHLASQALASKALWEHNSLLAGVIDGSSASIAIADARQHDAPLVYVNSAFERLTGYTASEAVGQNCRFLAADADETPERARLRETVCKRSIGQFELLNRRKDGTAFWNQLTLHPVVDEHGAAQYLVATQVDISSRKQFALERDAERARLTSALSSTSQGFLLVDQDARVVFANQAFRAFYPSNDQAWQTGRSVVDAWQEHFEETGQDPKQARLAAEERRDYLLQGAAQREEQLADGRLLLVTHRATTDGGAVCVVSDVSELIAAKRQLAEHAVAIDAARDGAAVTNAEGRFVYMNKSHMAMFGIRDLAEATSMHWTDLYHEAEAERLKRVAFPELSRFGGWRGEALGKRCDGSDVEQEISLTLVDHGRLVCVTRDIAERKRLEREQTRLRNQLQVAQRREVVGQLAAGIAHDFNNVLAVAAGSAAMLQSDLPPGSVQRICADRIAAAAEQGRQLMARLIDAGRHETQRERIDLCAPVRDALDLLRAGCPHEVDLQGTLPAEPLYAQAEPTDILQVVLNLGINARDAIDGRGRITIHLRPAVATDLEEEPVLGTIGGSGAYVCLEVSDNGCGMAEDVIANIFNPYFSTKGDAGSGLGLSVVSGIVVKNHAALTLKTAVGQGTRFTLLLPVSDASIKEAAQTFEMPPELSAKTVLVAEDSVPVLTAIESTLTRAGFEVGACNDPRDALSALEDDPDFWHAMITDYQMPHLTGVALAKEARRHKPGLPILLCTAMDTGYLLKQGASGLFDGIIHKPFSPQELIGALAAAISVRQLKETEHAHSGS